VSGRDLASTRIFNCCESKDNHNMMDVRKTTNYQVVFQREGHDIETLYWTGSRGEIRKLSAEFALKCGADVFQIVRLAGSDPERRSRRLPISRPRRDR
jgi:hypothetical protein